MRILFCNYEYPPLGGGGGIVNAMLAEELAARHSVSVLTSAGLELPENEIRNGVEITRVPTYARRRQASANLASMAAYMGNGVRYGKKLIRVHSFDVVNTHFVLPSGPVGNFVAHASGLPNILSVHGGDLYDPSKFTSPHRHWLLRLWIRRLLAQADALVGQSQNTIHNVQQYYIADLDVQCIPLGIVRPIFPPASRGELGLAADEFVLTSIGRLVARKGLDRLLHIVSKANINRLKLLIMGSGPQKDQLQKLADELGLANAVRFLGFVDEEQKNQLLQVSDLYVSSSQHEGFGLVFLEAMAAGLPIICYNNGGQCDFLEDDLTGALLDLNDEAGFIKRLQSLVQDVDRRNTIGTYNRQKVEDFFIDSCAAKYEILFEETIRRYQRQQVTN